MSKDKLKNIIETIFEIAIIVSCIVFIVLGIPYYTRAEWGILAAIVLYGIKTRGEL